MCFGARRKDEGKKHNPLASMRGTEHRQATPAAKHVRNIREQSPAASSEKKRQNTGFLEVLCGLTVRRVFREGSRRVLRGKGEEEILAVINEARY
jgi:hypothetical protein